MRLYLYALLLAVVALVAHVTAGREGWYASIGLYDVFMHLLVGFCVGLTIAAVLRSLKVVPRRRILLVGAVALGIGVSWEIFEASYEIAGAPVGTLAYYVDTAKDLFNDLFGAGVAFLIANRTDDKSNHE